MSIWRSRVDGWVDTKTGQQAGRTDEDRWHDDDRYAKWLLTWFLVSVLLLGGIAIVFSQ